MLRRSLACAVVALGALLGTGPAAATAHPLLVQAAPAAGLVAPKAPTVVSLSVSEPGVARGSSITVTGPGGKKVATGPVAGDGTTFSATLPAGLPSAVYDVQYTILGDDGHRVGGDFSFGVARADGAAPAGVEKLEGAGGSGRGSEDVTTDGAVAVVARWLGIVGASILLGGFLLVGALRRKGEETGVDALRLVAPLLWTLVVLAGIEAVLAAAYAGAGEDLDLGLLTDGNTGRAVLARIVVVALVTLALVVLRRARDRVYAAGGLLVLLTYALSGHVLAGGSAWALLDQTVHVLAAGLWLGGVLALGILVARGGVAVTTGARAFAPIAAGALGLAVVTGVLAAVREVDRWYFLRWSDYGKVVIAKSVLVAVVAGVGAVVALRARRAAGEDAPPAASPRSRLLRVEAFGVAAIVVLAATMSGLAQGRGQPLPAQRGNLFPGPSFSTALAPGGPLLTTLAPGEPGENTFVATPDFGTKAPAVVAARFVEGGGGRTVNAELTRGATGAWSTRVRLPERGSWFAYLTVDGKTAPPVSVEVGAPTAPGSEPVRVLATADLSGPNAERCRSHLLGLSLAVGRVNARGGYDGRKLVPTVLDDGGDPRRAIELVRAQPRPTAFVGCGDAAGDAAAEMSKQGVPSLLGDPSAPPVDGDRAFRLAVDPYAEGLSLGQLLVTRILPTGAQGVRRVLVVAGEDRYGRRLVQGLTEATKGSAVELDVQEPGALEGLRPRALGEKLSRLNVLALVLDGPKAGGADADALAALGRARPNIPPAVQLLSERVLSEPLVLRAGSLGRIGVLQGTSEVSTTTRDAILYRDAVPLLHPGERASLDGLRGYVTGLALDDALAAPDPTAFLRSPSVFTDALLTPWTRTQPGAGSSASLPIQPQFLPERLVPRSIGGEGGTRAYFPDGTWTLTSQRPLGMTPGSTAPGL